MDKEFLNLRDINKNCYKQLFSENDRRKRKIDASCGFNKFSHSDCIERSEFSRDKDRILFSRAFRRLEHKAQIYSHEKGDHYRTRLTHTLEVLQIGRNISRYLGLDEDLTEAIVLGHDIGHTPFGHEGERVLNEVLNGSIKYDDLLYKIDFNGFKHNYNSVKILDIIERKYEKELGLNLSWQVLEGILKHTTVKKNGKPLCEIDRFLLDEPENNQFNHQFKEYLMYDDSVTLEGQVVAIADEIAQRQHDLDDGLRDIKLGLDYDDLFKEIKKYINEIMQSNDAGIETSFVMQLKELEKGLDSRNKIYKDNDFKRDAIIRDLIEYFICDVTRASFNNIKNHALEAINHDGDRKIFTKKLINYSTFGKKLDDKVKTYIKNRIVNSNEVNKFDGKANYVIKRLFKAYYSNPRQMSDSSLKRLSRIILSNSEIFDITLNEYKDDHGNPIEIKNIVFSESEPDLVNKLIEYLKLEIDLKELSLHLIPLDSIYLKHGEEKLKLNPDCVRDVNKIGRNEAIHSKNADIKFVKCILEDHYAYLSVICDQISSMTDNFANNEYALLYQT